MARSKEAIKRAQAKYEKKRRATGTSPLKAVSLKLHIEHDADIIAMLEAQDNKNGYIKALIRKDIKTGQ